MRGFSHASFVHAAGPFDLESIAASVLDLSSRTLVPDQLSYVTDGYPGAEVVTDFHSVDGLHVDLAGVGEGLFFSGSLSFPWSLWLEHDEDVIALRGDINGDIVTQEINLFMNDIFSPVAHEGIQPGMSGYIEIPGEYVKPLFLAVNQAGSARFYVVTEDSDGDRDDREARAVLAPVLPSNHSATGSATGEELYIFSSGLLRDRIKNLDHQGLESLHFMEELRTDLLVDADLDTEGNQSFAFSGRVAAPHALWWYQPDEKTDYIRLQGDTDGDIGRFELDIVLKGLLPLPDAWEMG